jgi:hypothetical protein
LEIFGAEPAHNWCYYYEKAELARQFKDWQQVAALEQAAQQAGLATHYGTELIPFIEGLANQEQWQTAYQYTDKALHLDGDRFIRQACPVWQRIQIETADSPEKETTLAAASQLLKCRLR